MFKESNTKIYVTEDYSIFKLAEWNRTVKDGRVAKIEKSINAVGYITNPIIVNEHYEIVDGQGRFIALKKMKRPIEFIVCPGTGKDECQNMNISQSNWSDRDFIASYAKTNGNYARMQTLIKETKASINLALWTATNTVKSSGKATSEYIRSGRIIFPAEEYSRAKFEALYVTDLNDIHKVIGGRKEYLQAALLYAYRSLDVLRRQELAETLRKNVYMIPPYGDVANYLKHFDELYNKGKQKARRIHLRLQWETDRM